MTPEQRGVLAMNGASGVLVWTIVLILGLVLLFAAVVFLKRWLRAEDEPGPGGFTLSDLRELHRRGEITDEEFERTREQLVQEARKQVHPPKTQRRDTL